jgi:hypothetical protein
LVGITFSGIGINASFVRSVCGRLSGIFFSAQERIEMNKHNSNSLLKKILFFIFKMFLQIKSKAWKH